MSDATIGNAPTKLTRFDIANAQPEALEGLADRIDGAMVPLTVLEMTQAISALLRRVAKLERARG